MFYGAVKFCDVIVDRQVKARRYKRPENITNLRPTQHVTHGYGFSQQPFFVLVEVLKDKLFDVHLQVFEGNNIKTCNSSITLAAAAAADDDDNK